MAIGVALNRVVTFESNERECWTEGYCLEYEVLMIETVQLEQRGKSEELRNEEGLG